MIAQSATSKRMYARGVSKPKRADVLYVTSEDPHSILFRGKSMKIDRRCFLSLVIGGAAGTALTPLPWKMTDDSSIWSQNWPWTPVIAKGETFYESSACTLCPGGCGITVRMIEDRTVKIEGQTGHPVNDGGVCVLGLSGLQLLYNPNRVTRPMKRTGSRGSGRWEPISWDDAIGQVVSKLSELRENCQPQKVGC
ncbi:MAG TPA: hypothetical protein ENL37_00160, partial [Desulfobacteraceae bacterium]|nr:hypothetical protein [Desulfobacteraceae bacterium]